MTPGEDCTTGRPHQTSFPGQSCLARLERPRKPVHDAEPKSQTSNFGAFWAIAVAPQPRHSTSAAKPRVPMQSPLFIPFMARPVTFMSPHTTHTARSYRCPKLFGQCKRGAWLRPRKR
jgi:hypothetical protein